MRITPAYAGKSRRNTFQPPSPQGSPPPMRGKAQNRINRIIDFGITPAYAGKSSFSTMFIKISEDHPRLCGEKHNARINRTGHVGSPPPMRGKVLNTGGFREAVRITPAYAGKSFGRVRRGTKSKDHPRLCGEKSA